MQTLIIIPQNKFTQTLLGFSYGLVALVVDIFLLNCSPQPLNKDIVEAPTFTIHADLNLFLL